MASELSRFIEDELKKQGINDDEEQRLLSNLRVKPLSVQAPRVGGAAAGWSRKQKAVVAFVVLALFAGLAFSVLHYRGHPLTTGNWRGGLAEPEAGVEPLPPLPTKGGGDKQQQQQKEQQAKEAAAAAAAAELELEEEMQEEAHSGKAPTPEKAAGGGMPKNETKAATPELSEAELEQLQEEEGERRRRTLRRRRAW